MTARTESIAKPREERRENDQYETPIELCTAVCKLLAGLNPKRVLEPGAGGGNFVMAARKQWPGVHITAVEIMPKLVSVTDRATTLALRKKWKKDLEYWKWERETKGSVSAKPREPPAPEPSDDTVARLTAAGASVAWIGDYLQPEPLGGALEPRPYDLILGNPPYSLAEQFVIRSMSVLAPGGVLAFVLKLHFFGTEKRIELWRQAPFFAAFPIVPRPDFTGEGRDTAEYCLITWKKAKDGMLIANKQLVADQPILWRWPVMS